MAIEIHEKFKAQLIKKLIPLVKKIKFTNGKFLDHETTYPLSELDELLKNRRDLQETLTKLLGERPLSSFFGDHLARILAENAEWKEDSSGFITELSYFGKAEEIASKLIDLLGTLGWSYTVTYVLPESLDRLLPEGKDQYVISETSRLVRVTEEIQTEFPLANHDGRNPFSRSLLASLMGPNDLPLGRVLFQTQVVGYVAVYGRGEALRRAEIRLKALIGFLIACRTIEVDLRYISTVPHFGTVAHEWRKGGWSIAFDGKIDDELSSLFAKLEVSDVDGKIKEEHFDYWIKFGLDRVRSGFSESTTSDRLQLAAKWLSESYSNNRDLLGFVQAMVCLEIILGDQEDTQELGLGATIRNRCAYLIGRSHQERERISNELKTIYRVRSKIVHTGKDQLTRDDYVMLFLLRDYCGRVLARELEIATKN